MVLHSASIAAFLIDTVSQAPTIPQGLQTAPEPWWKWIVQSVVPVAGGTLIAVWSFVQNRKSEQRQWIRNQQAAHRQWVLDQKKAAWSQLMNAIHDCHFYGEYGEVPTLRVDPTPRLESIVALNRDRMLRIDQLLSSMKIWIESDVLCSLQNQLSEFKKLRIHYEDEGGTTNSADSKWANAFWLPSTKYAEFVDAVCITAKKDLGIELVNPMSEPRLRDP